MGLGTENYIEITGGSYESIKKALQQWIDLYSNDLKKDITFELYKNAGGKCAIKVNKELDNLSFAFLVNYLKYPEKIDYNVEVKGFVTATDKELFPKNLLNQKFIFYISENDTEYDNVFAVSENNKIFKIDFGGKIKEAKGSMTYHSEIDTGLLSEKEVLKTNRKELSKNETKKAKNEIGKRFKIILLIALGLVLVSILYPVVQPDTNIDLIFWIGLGLGAWFFSDYKMLQNNKYYFFCLLIALGYFGYGYLIEQQLIYSNTRMVKIGSLYPLPIIIIQRPLRIIFKYLFKREPEIEYIPASFLDLIYTVILFLSFVVLPFILIENLH